MASRRSRGRKAKRIHREITKLINAHEADQRVRDAAAREPVREDRPDQWVTSPKRKAAKRPDRTTFGKVATGDQRPMGREHLGPFWRTQLDSRPFVAVGRGPVRRFRDLPNRVDNDNLLQLLRAGTHRVLKCGTVQNLITGRFVPGHAPELYS